MSVVKNGITEKQNTFCDKKVVLSSTSSVHSLCNNNNWTAQQAGFCMFIYTMSVPLPKYAIVWKIYKQSSIIHSNNGRLISPPQTDLDWSEPQQQAIYSIDGAKSRLVNSHSNRCQFQSQITRFIVYIFCFLQITCFPWWLHRLLFREHRLRKSQVFER